MRLVSIYIPTNHVYVGEQQTGVLAGQGPRHGMPALAWWQRQCIWLAKPGKATLWQSCNSWVGLSWCRICCLFYVDGWVWCGWGWVCCVREADGLAG